MTFNLPSLGAGADFKVAAAYTEGDLTQAGVYNPWFGNVNLSGVAFNGATGDIYYDLEAAG